MNVSTKVYLDRRTDGKLEKVLDSKYSDLAEIAAKALSEQLRCRVIVVFDQKGFPPKAYTWGKKEVVGVVETEVPNLVIEECND